MAETREAHPSDPWAAEVRKRFCDVTAPGSAVFEFVRGSDPGPIAIFAASLRCFRAEKRSAQASAHPLSQAQGGLFCVLTTVCLFVTERVLTKTE